MTLIHLIYHTEACVLEFQQLAWKPSCNPFHSVLKKLNLFLLTIQEDNSPCQIVEKQCSCHGCGHGEKMRDFVWRIQVCTMCEIADFCRRFSCISALIKLMFVSDFSYVILWSIPLKVQCFY